jgi:hypothetical protein
MTDPDDSAFPDEAGSCGLSKREYFAAMAMQGFLSLCASDKTKYLEPSMLSHDAIALADALIAELNKEAKP